MNQPYSSSNQKLAKSPDVLIPGSVERIRASQDGNLIVTSAGKQFCLYDGSFESIFSQAFDRPVLKITVSENGKIAGAITADRKLILVDSRDRKAVLEKQFDSEVGAIAISPSGGQVGVVLPGQGCVRFFITSSGNEVPGALAIPTDYKSCKACAMTLLECQGELETIVHCKQQVWHFSATGHIIHQGRFASNVAKVFQHGGQVKAAATQSMGQIHLCDSTGEKERQSYRLRWLPGHASAVDGTSDATGWKSVFVLLGHRLYALFKGDRNVTALGCPSKPNDICCTKFGAVILVACEDGVRIALSLPTLIEMVFSGHRSDEIQADFLLETCADTAVLAFLVNTRNIPSLHEQSFSRLIQRVRESIATKARERQAENTSRQLALQQDTENGLYLQGKNALLEQEEKTQQTIEALKCRDLSIQESIKNLEIKAGKFDPEEAVFSKLGYEIEVQHKEFKRKSDRLESDVEKTKRLIQKLEAEIPEREKAARLIESREAVSVLAAKIQHLNLILIECQNKLTATQKCLVTLELCGSDLQNLRDIRDHVKSLSSVDEREIRRLLAGADKITEILKQLNTIENIQSASAVPNRNQSQSTHHASTLEHAVIKDPMVNVESPGDKDDHFISTTS